MIQIPEIIGLPPAGYTTDKVIEASMPIAEFSPAEPKFQLGMTVFQLDTRAGSTEYKNILSELGYYVRLPLRVAFLADSFPTDTFSNEYSESFLQKTTDVVSQAAGEIAQITNTKGLGEGIDKISGALKKSDSSILSGVGSMLAGGKEMTEDLFKSLGEAVGGEGGGKFAEQTGKTMSSMLAGARVDFPQVWRNSGFSPSYTMTVRLYNPKPSSEDATEKYILGPIAALMLLGLPRTKDGATYNWPFLHQIVCPLIYNLNPAFISNVTIIKGGDQQSIAWNQRLGIVDVRIDFGSLYNSILAGIGYDSDDRPTLENYIRAMRDERKIEDGIFYGKPSEYKASPADSPHLIASKGTNVSSVQILYDSDATAKLRVNAEQTSTGILLAGENVNKGIGSIVS